MRLGAGGLQAGGLPVGLGGLIVAAHLVTRHAQVEPVLEAVGRRLCQRAAVLRGSGVVSVLKGQGGQRLGGGGRIRLDLRQHLRVTPHAAVILLLEEHGNQV